MADVKNEKLNWDPCVYVSVSFLRQIGIPLVDYEKQTEYEVFIMSSRSRYHWLVALINDDHCLMIHNRSCGSQDIEITAFKDPLKKYYMWPAVPLNSKDLNTPAKAIFSVRTLSMFANGLSTQGNCQSFVTRFLNGRELKPSLSRICFFSLRPFTFYFENWSLDFEDRIKSCKWYKQGNEKSLNGLPQKGSINV